jgi:hypothetical protein
VHNYFVRENLCEAPEEILHLGGRDYENLWGHLIKCANLSNFRKGKHICQLI